MSRDVFDAIRAGCADVSRRARSVAIDRERLAALAERLADASPPPPDPAHHYRGGPEATVAFVLTLDALNFGSGYFPFLRKRPGCSGYFTIAGALVERFEARGPFGAGELAATGAGDCARLFDQDRAVPEVAELMELFAAALRQLGALLEERYGGAWCGPVEEAGGAPEALVEILSSMPFYRDVARYDGIDVPFYKRAQLSVADLARAFDGRGAGAFRGLDRLTLFADNLVPHVLRCEGVLRYRPELARCIDAEEPLPAGSPEEVEIRACAVQVVEECVAALRAAGRESSARDLDGVLWSRGQRPEFKARPRHRTRCTYY